MVQGVNADGMMIVPTPLLTRVLRSLDIELVILGPEVRVNLIIRTASPLGPSSVPYYSLSPASSY